MTPTVLVVGGDSMLGRRLLAHLKTLGIRAIGTTRRSRPDSDEVIFLDLAHRSEWRIPEGITHAAIMAAVCDRKACETDPEGTTRINVDNTIALASRLAAAGAHLLYPSTDKIFDGSRPNRLPSDAPCPVEEYGRQKARVEAALGKFSGTAIFRITKVVGPTFALMEGWVRDLRAGRPIFPFSDAVQSPVSLDLVVDAMTRLMLKDCTGIFQLSASRDVTFAEMAFDLAGLLAADPTLVRPTPATILFHRHSKLDGTTLKAATGLDQPPPVKAIETFVAHLNRMNAEAH